MATYIGFNTISTSSPDSYSVAGVNNSFVNNRTPQNTNKKFQLTDENLVIQDFLNALNIRRGEKVGQPKYGTTLWDFVFDPNTRAMQEQLIAEITRVAELDPRLILNSVLSFPQDNGILIQLELAIAPFNNAQILSVFLNNFTSTASIA